MEIEAKFRVDDVLMLQRLVGLDRIGDFRLIVDPHPENQHNVYFDTADGRLRSRRYGLRVRDLGDRRIATLKGAAQVQDGVYERDEWEVEIGADQQPEAWPPSEARERALALLEGLALQPIVTVRTLRHHIFAERDDARVAELSLDEGTIEASGQELHFRELEIELLSSGARADFDALVALLRERFALVPEERSKLQRGLALLREKLYDTDDTT